MQACSDLAHVVLVLVGVRRVTVVIVHIGLEGVLVVIHFCVAILFVNCCIRRRSLYRMRMGNSIPQNHEDHIAGKGENSLQHYNLVHKFIPMPQAMIIPAAKAAVDKEWENWRKFRRGT